MCMAYLLRISSLNGSLDWVMVGVYSDDLYPSLRDEVPASLKFQIASGRCGS